MNSKSENINISPLRILKRINNHLEIKRKKQVLFVFTLSIFSSLSESISIALLIPFVSFFINPEAYLFNTLFKNVFLHFGIVNEKDVLKFVAFSFIIIVFISCLIRLIYIKTSNKLSEQITSDFRIKIFNFLINQDYSYYFKNSTNEIMSNLAQKTSSFTVIVFATMNIINGILISVAVTSVLIFNEPFFTTIIIFSIIIFFYFIYRIKSQKVFKKGQNINLNQNVIIDNFENTVGYLQEVLIYNLKKFFLSTLTKVSKEIAKSSSDIRTIGMSPRIYLEAFVIIFVVLLIYFSNFNERSTIVNVSYLAILAFGAQKCLPLVNNVYNLSINFKSATPTVISFLDILDKGKLNYEEKEESYDQLKFDRDINLKNISFKYEGSSTAVLNNIDLIIKKGEKVAIKGRTGSGKSTLINIILGLIKPTKGNLLVDGTDINSINIKGWQKNIALVPQTVFLNNATILENIAIGEKTDQIDYERAVKSAKIAFIDEYINSLSKKYYEKVGEKGIRLSGGQKQRIGIARALYRNSRIVILDEPSNALDSNTEKLVIEKLNNLGSEITIIMISHSENSLQFFDRIFDLDKIS